MAPASSEDGMVTAEFAVALPAFVMVLLAALFAVAVVLAQLRCQDAAAAAARLAARGETVASVRPAVLTDAPRGASLSVVTADGMVTATVRGTVAPLGGLGFLPSITVSAHVVQAVEPGG